MAGQGISGLPFTGVLMSMLSPETEPSDGNCPRGKAHILVGMCWWWYSAGERQHKEDKGTRTST